jgi:hypothetical protein
MGFRYQSLTNYSGSITTGGTSQQLCPENSSRAFLLVQNTSDQNLYIGIGLTPTSTNGILLTPNGGGVVFEEGVVPVEQINIIGATAGKSFMALEG